MHAESTTIEKPIPPVSISVYVYSRLVTIEAIRSPTAIPANIYIHFTVESSAFGALRYVVLLSGSGVGSGAGSDHGPRMSFSHS